MYEISVVVPVYNVEEYIEECLDSLVKQTIFNKLKVIIINDGSTDNTISLANKYADTYDNFTIYNFENGGLSVARNRGIDLCNTKYIAFLDSDDYVHPKMYEDLLSNVINDQSDICSCATRRFNSEVSRVPILHRNSIKDEYHGVKYYEVPKIAYDMSTCNKLFKLSLFNDNDIRFIPGQLYEDIDVSIRTFSKSNKISIINKVYYNWRMREGSITASKKEIDNLKGRIDIIEKSINYILKEQMDNSFLLDFLEKSFRYDFIYYIDEFNELDSEYKEYLLNNLKIIVDNFKKQIIDLIPAKDKIKYYYIINNQAKELSNYINEFEANIVDKFVIDGMAIPAFGRRQSKYLKYEMKKCQLCAINSKVTDINVLLEKTDQPFNPFLNSVKIDNEKHNITIQAGLLFYNVESFIDNTILKVYTQNIDNDNTICIEEIKPNFDKDNYYFTFDYNIDLNKLNPNDRFKVVIEIINNDISHKLYLVSPISSKAKPYFKIIDDNIVRVYYNFKNEIVVERKELIRAVELTSLNKKGIGYNLVSRADDVTIFLENQEEFSKIKLEKNIIPTKKLLINKRYKFIGQNSNGVGYDYTNIITKAVFINQDDYIIYVSRGRKGQMYITKIQKDIMIKNIEINNNNIEITIVENVVLNKKLSVSLKGEKDSFEFEKINDEKYIINYNRLKMREDRAYEIVVYTLDANNKPIHLNVLAGENYYIDSRLKCKNKITFIKNPLAKTFINRIKNKIGRLKI